MSSGFTASLSKKSAAKGTFAALSAESSRLQEPFHLGHEGSGVRVNSRSLLAVDQFPVDGEFENSAAGGNELKGFNLVLVLAQ
jgi:hypothetical protein